MALLGTRLAACQQPAGSRAAHQFRRQERDVARAATDVEDAHGGDDRLSEKLSRHEIDDSRRRDTAARGRAAGDRSETGRR